MTKRVKELYAKFRESGEWARVALQSARTVADWERLETDENDTQARFGSVRIRAEFDFDVDVSCMTRKQLEAWDGEAVGVIGEYWDGSQWVHADSVWGFIGYRDPLDPVENSYVPDIMGETLEALASHLQNEETALIGVMQ